MDYERLIAPAAKAMRPSGIRKFFDLAADMPECISLGVGEPDFKTPWAVREAGIESLEHGRTRYTSNAGLKELRAEITRYLARRMNLHYEPSQGKPRRDLKDSRFKSHPPFLMLHKQQFCLFYHNVLPCVNDSDKLHIDLYFSVFCTHRCRASIYKRHHRC